jgi:glutamine synthetase type III
MVSMTAGSSTSAMILDQLTPFLRSIEALARAAGATVACPRSRRDGRRVVTSA